MPLRWPDALSRAALAAAARRHLPTVLSATREIAALVRRGRLAQLPAAGVARFRALPRLQRGLVAALALLTLGLPFLPEGHAALEREIAALLERGDVAAARRRLDGFARERPGDPVVEKLRGDVACAAGEPSGCLRHYRVALAQRPALAEDAVLRENARRLLRPSEACGTRRAAAYLVGQLRDPGALPALEEARRSGGVFAYFCTGDSIDRAITATRAAAR